MSFLNNVTQRARSERIREVKEAIKAEQVAGEGKNKTAYLTNRNEVVKPVIHDSNKNKFLKHQDKLKQISGFPMTEIQILNLSDLGLWKETAVVLQERADYSHETALEDYGTDIIEEITRMFDNLNSQGFIYMDSKPDNIGFLQRSEEMEAAPIDVLDDAAYSFAPEDLSDVMKRNMLASNIANQYDLYINGSDYAEGLVDRIEYEGEGKIEEELTMRAVEHSDILEDVEYQDSTLDTVRESVESVLEDY